MFNPNEWRIDWYAGRPQSEREANRQLIRLDLVLQAARQLVGDYKYALGTPPRLHWNLTTLREALKLLDKGRVRDEPGEADSDTRN